MRARHRLSAASARPGLAALALTAAAGLALAGCTSLPDAGGTVGAAASPSGAVPAASSLPVGPTPAPGSAPGGATVEAVAAPDEAAGSTVKLSSVPPGVCFVWSMDEDGEAAEVVPCGHLHDGQVVTQAVFGGVVLPDAADSAWDEVFDGQCSPAFATFTGTAWASSRLTMSFAMPTQQEFAHGVRAMTCFIEMYDQSRFRGSAAGRHDEKQFGHEDGWMPPTDLELGVSGQTPSSS